MSTTAAMQQSKAPASPQNRLSVLKLWSQALRRLREKEIGDTSSQNRVVVFSVKKSWAGNTLLCKRGYAIPTAALCVGDAAGYTVADIHLVKKWNCTRWGLWQQRRYCVGTARNRDRSAWAACAFVLSSWCRWRFFESNSNRPSRFPLFSDKSLSKQSHCRTRGLSIFIRNSSIHSNVGRKVHIEL